MTETPSPNEEIIRTALAENGDNLHSFLSVIMDLLDAGPPGPILAAAEAALGKESDPTGIAWLKLITGLVMLRLRKFSEIKAVAEELIGDESLSSQLRSHGLFLRAQTQFADAMIDETKATCEEAIAIYDGETDNVTAMHLNILGACCRQLNEYRKALDYYNMALEREEKFQPCNVFSGLYYNIALVHTELGNMAKAEEALGKVLEIEKDRDNAVIVAHTTSSLADILFRQGKYDEALEYAEDAFAKLQDVENYHIRTVNLLALSDIHLALGNHGTALESAEQCLAFSEKSNEKILILESKLLHAVVLAEIKSPAAEKKLPEALDYYDEAISGKPALNLEKALIAYGKILMEKNDPGAHGCLIRAEKNLEIRAATPQVETILAELRAYLQSLP